MLEDSSAASAHRGEHEQPRMLSSPTSGFPEALAALNLQQSCPDDSNETEKLASVSQTSDSGYSSAGATPITATQEYRTLEASRTFPRDGRRMSFAAIARTPTLKVFERPIPDTIQNRFDDLNELFSRALLDHLQKARIDARGQRTISIKLKYLGQSEESAKPCVLILCSKEACRKVKQFFNTKAVKSQYQPNEPSTSLPHLEVKVYDRPPRAIGLIGSIPSNQSSHFPNSVAYPAVCGQSLRLSEDGANHFGTLGGLVMITSYSGSSSMFGMSAGHIVPEEDQDSSAHPRFGLRSPSEHWTIDSILEESEQNSAEFEDDDDDASFSDSESIKLSFDSESHRAESPKPTQKLSRLVELPEVPWSAVGPLWKTSTSPHWTTHQNNLDWSLISIDKPLRYDPNLFQANQERVEVKEACSHKLVSLKQDRQVMVFCGISGRKAGILSRTMSCLALGTGKAFVKTYDLKILGGMGEPHLHLDKKTLTWCRDSSSRRRLRGLGLRRSYLRCLWPCGGFR